jgi:hypothetical protein
MGNDENPRWWSFVRAIVRWAQVLLVFVALVNVVLILSCDGVALGTSMGDGFYYLDAGNHQTEVSRGVYYACWTSNLLFVVLAFPAVVGSFIFGSCDASKLEKPKSVRGQSSQGGQ